ncbi:bifunctional transcriptional activator/DNA repair enzyme AdaA [Marinococcus halophilus]|uniref:bifunctional transcriptional activator/DNA repair enzyme AdaA n=1 Tax=Marinococcus halophilus TaxID=1371 RepID=UPI0015C45B78|nr:Ada metal-binding domain-containing protein [Marinococcus halophilus]
MKTLTPHEKYQAVLQNNVTYDDQFFYSVRTTGIYCKPSCPSKPPKEENIVFFLTAESAQQAGFRPCKRCLGSLYGKALHEYMVRTIKDMVHRDFASSLNTTIIASHMHYSPSYVHRVFKQQTSYTIHAYIKKTRMEQAKYLLQHSSFSRLEIAYHVGFKHPSQLYEAFKEFQHCTLTEFVQESIKF